LNDASPGAGPEEDDDEDEPPQAAAMAPVRTMRASRVRIRPDDTPSQPNTGFVV
jgi:hypothetical protein